MNHNGSKYETIWSAEDGGNDGERDEILSETDVDSTHLPEKPWEQQQHRDHDDEEEGGGGGGHGWRRSNKTRLSRRRGDRSRLLATLQAWRGAIDTGLLLVIAGLLVVVLLRERPVGGAQGGNGAGAFPQIGSDFTGSERHCMAWLTLSPTPRLMAGLTK